MLYSLGTCLQVAWFIPNSLHLLLFYPIAPPHFPLPAGNCWFVLHVCEWKMVLNSKSCFPQVRLEKLGENGKGGNSSVVMLMSVFIHSFNRHFLDTCSRPRTTWCAGEVLLKTVSQFSDTSVTCTWGEDVCLRGLRESQGRERAQATAGRRGGEFYPGIRGVIFKAEALFSLVAQMVKNPPVNAGNQGSIPGTIPWRRTWQPTPVFLPAESHGQRSLAGYSPWGCKELDRTEWLTLSL